MSDSHRDHHHHITLELTPLDERIAPTSVSSLGVAAQAAHGPHGSLNHDYFQPPVLNGPVTAGSTSDTTSGSGSAMGSGLVGSTQEGGHKGSLNHDFFRPPGFSAAAATNSATHSQSSSHAFAHTPSSQLTGVVHPDFTVLNTPNANNLQGPGQTFAHTPSAELTGVTHPDFTVLTTVKLNVHSK